MRFIPSFHKADKKPKHKLPNWATNPEPAPRVVCDIDTLTIKVEPLPAEKRAARKRDIAKLKGQA